MKPIFEKQKISPDDSLYFFGLVVRASLEDIEKIKGFVLELPKTRLCYQHKDVEYLKIYRAEPKVSPNDAAI